MRSLILTAILIMLPSVAVAQWDDRDPENSMFQTQEEYHQFMGEAKRSVATNPEMKAMIPMLNDIALGRQFGATAKRFGSQDSTLGMLSDPKIRGDLEMIDEQYKELQQLNSEIQKRVADQIRSLDFSNSKDLVVQLRRIRDDARKDIDGLLLPHQTRRLQQLRIQNRLRRESLVDLLTSSPVREDLDISDAQSKELRQAQQEIQQDLAKEIAKLQEKARDRLISKLKPSQRQKAKDLIGDAFEFNPPTRQQKKASPKSESYRGKGK